MYFHKLRNSTPNPESHQDKLALACIRRINLDAFWARASSTVNNNLSKTKTTIAFSEAVGMLGPFEHKGRYGMEDQAGYETAICTVLYSIRPGRNSDSHTQFGVIRGIRTVVGNHSRTTPQANTITTAMVDDKGRYKRLVEDKCASLWFSRFTQGLQIRMGQIWKPNKAFSIPLLFTLLDKAGQKIHSSSSENERHQWVIFVSY
jgi:hypothetical protein